MHNIMRENIQRLSVLSIENRSIGEDTNLNYKNK